ncbi:biliverdin-producing heme oxygenase [Ramlibacter humi]|uniref:Biliverdin-producing heme oxygenase n=1 Tax=Ramlibacter humi TaxID=2530451 RepID=A0A4Z0BKC1_9BURK|nr:biliverdin-producing heme oxygenase [Ramlibacter humi]TFY98348.1 biliverdin-producing heme oxygenase [Ramlibacter humi]
MLPSQQFPAPTSGRDGAMAALRAGTAAQHDRIEALLGLGGPFGHAHYGRVLQGFFTFLAGWEKLVAAALPQRLLGWAGGQRSGRVADDLHMLGLEAPTAGAQLPAIHGPAQALGSLYVLEGSALGGQVISRHLRDQLGIEPHSGGAYFHGEGAATGARWRDFRATVEAELAGDDRALAQAVDAAARTFEALLATFQDRLHERAAA